MIKRIKQWFQKRAFNAGYDYAAGCLLRGEKPYQKDHMWDDTDEFDYGVHRAIIDFQDRFKSTPNAKKLWRGCALCYGSGGKKDNPCRVCNGTGKIYKDKK